MHPEFDLSPAADALADIVTAIDDAQLEAPTPADVPVRVLIQHVDGLAEAFRAAATKESLGASAAPEFGSGAALPAQWRIAVPARLRALARAWREPAAWQGDTEAGGVTMPAPVTARVALDEIVVHAWDLAHATCQELKVGDSDLAVLLDFLKDTPAEGTPGLFGPIVPIGPAAPVLHRVLGLAGRDPFWIPRRGEPADRAAG
ncbi:TIGR03086 family protein [Nocardia speluncae]|uniref:TIGR03086 family protein n=1 Tax=Nocardia speluncae TaxID=419477 RepID=A0A846XSP1_9NOCA|nr:TIGR03086 family metal-binding protein [Nocardia speluncae]NKY37776.1 TIGR03086 family protein [Nocardia speluncae]